MRTTIKERAKAFCEKNICVDCGDRKDCDRGCMGCCIPTFSVLEWLIQFGKSERAELTRWHDPKEELPTDSRWVLVHTQDELQPYCTGRYFEETQDTKAYWFIRGNSDWTFDYVIGWREIHE